MKQFLLALVCLLALPSFGLSAELTADADYGVKYDAQERVITLPQDQGQWYVTVFGDPGDSDFLKVQRWFETTPGLVHLRSQVHYNVYSSNSVRYRQRYAANIPNLPCVRVQDSKGHVVSEFWCEHLPMTGEALYSGIAEDLRTKAGCPFRRRRCNPQPTPTPQPTPQPDPDSNPVDTPPVIEPTPEPAQPGFPWLLALASALIGGGIGVGQGFKKEHLDAPTPAGPKVP